MQVELIAVTQSLVDRVQSQEQLIEYAGRICYASTDKTGQNTNNFIKARVKQGHTSILEHINFTFEISGISRSCLAQLTRHRIGFSPSVESMRYVKQNGAEFVVPPTIKNNKFTNMVFTNAVKYCEGVYAKLLNFGIKPEDARFILPLSTSTKLILTVNLRALLHFFELRTDKAAQWEIKALANRMKDMVMEYCPSAF